MKKNKNKNQFRQGDVLIERVTEVPASAEKQQHEGRIILAHGEATGHHHSIVSDKADWWKQGGEQFVSLPHKAKVVHQEHSQIPLNRGVFRVTRQREYSPESIRNVAD